MTEEEDNFIRIFKLISGVAPKAVRSKFDQYFPPTRLTTILTQEASKLRSFEKKKWLTTAQMDLLFPTTGVTSSINYDVTLMVCLLRNLTAIPQPKMFDVLPPSTDTSDGADLARVKYYRNKIAHPGTDKLPTSEFTPVWNDLEQALVRLGDSSVKATCDEIKQAVFSHDIILEVLQDISQFREEITLQLNQISSNVVALEEQMTVLRQESTSQMADIASTSRGIKRKLEECSCHDAHELDIAEWEQEDKIFVKTHVVDVILKKLQSNHFITVTGKAGIGKSAIIHHIALLLHRSQGYSIVPCTHPQEIKKHFQKDNFQVFVFDDVCGKYSVNHNDVAEWNKCEKNIILILGKQKTKILCSCRLQIFSEKRFQNFNMFKECYINLTNDELSLTTEEKIQIALKYLDEDTVNSCRDILEKGEFLPLICFLCKQNSPVNVKTFLSNPFTIYTDELNNMQNEHENTKWCALFLLILHNGNIKESFFGLDSHWRKDLEIFLTQICAKRGPIMYVKEQLESLVGTYIKRTETRSVNNNYIKGYEEVFFTTIHDTMFDFLCHYFGSNQQDIFIKFSNARVFEDRTQLESIYENHDQFKVIINENNEAGFFERISKDWKNGDYGSVLNHDQMKFERYRDKLISKLKLLDPLHINDRESALGIVCKAGYYDMFCFLLEPKPESDFNHNRLLKCACSGGNVDIAKTLIKMGADVNTKPAFHIFDDYSSNESEGGKIPLNMAFSVGYDPILFLLIDEGADVNQANEIKTPLIIACKGGHESIVTLLIDEGADVNQTTKTISPLISACRGGHESIVSLLIAKEAIIDDKTFAYSPLISACIAGNESIVTLLIAKGANVNLKTDIYSPLIAACEAGNLPLVTLLIDKGANINLTTVHSSPLQTACESGHESIVTLLIDKGANINQEKDKYSPLIAACHGGFLPIVSFMIDKGADVNQTTVESYSPLISACKKGHLPIVSLLINKGAEVNQATDAYSPLISACESGHLPIVSLLIDNNVDVNQTVGDKSPLISSCRRGYLPIVDLLIDKGANVNLTTHTYSPLISACISGNLPLVTLLIDKGADVNRRTQWKSVLTSWTILSPLLVAFIFERHPIDYLLIEKGADKNFKDFCGLSVSEYDGFKVLLREGLSLT